jgi:sulfatase-like protein/putative metal-binding protein
MPVRGPDTAGGPEKIAAPTALRRVEHGFCTWVILLTLAIDVLALTVEPTLLLYHHAPLRAAVATVCAAFGYSTLFSMAAAIPIASVYSLVRWAGRLPKPWSHLWPLPLLGLAWAVVTDVAPNPFLRLMDRTTAHHLGVALFATWLLLTTVVARSRRPLPRSIIAIFLGLATLGLSFVLPNTVHREPRDLLWLCTVVSFAALLYPVRRRLAATSPEQSARAFGALFVGSLGLQLLAPLVCPEWAVYGKDFGSFAERLGRFCRTVTDFDGDGYSALFGGTDCDDFDPLVNPGMKEKMDGKDRNCNGMIRLASSVPPQRGLAPAVGVPDAAPGEIDRVVLITIDCFRYDAMTAAVTPNLTRLATRGLRFTRLYAGGSRTATSLPLMQRGAYNLTPIASVLAEEKTSSTVVFGYHHSTLEDNVFHGFQTVELPTAIDARWRAPQVTDGALIDLRESAGHGNHLLWVHYFDAHGPRAPRILPSNVPHFPAISGEEPDSALYLSELFYIDQEIGRLLSGIEQIPSGGATMIIVTADHGEGFGSHNVYEHGGSAFEPIIHVPGILVAPGIAPGSTYDHVASHRDVPGTILGAFGLVATHPQAEEYGQSWLRLRAAPETPLHDFVVTYSSSAHVQTWGEAPLAVRTDDHTKLAVSYRDGIQRYYHLDSPEGETRDVTYNFPSEAAQLRQELEVFRDIDVQPP